MKHLAAVLLLLLFSTSLQADTIRQEQINGNVQIHYFEPLGQTFTAIDSTLQSVTLRLNTMNPQVGYAPITLRLLEGDGFAGAVLASHEFQLPGPIYDWYDFNLGSVPLSIGALYTLQLSSANEYWGVVYGDSNPYAGGKVLFNPNVCSDCQLTLRDADLTFRINGTSSAVPEPATLSLMSIGLAVAAWKRR